MSRRFAMLPAFLDDADVRGRAVAILTLLTSCSSHSNTSSAFGIDSGLSSADAGGSPSAGTGGQPTTGNGGQRSVGSGGASTGEQGSPLSDAGSGSPGSDAANASAGGSDSGANDGADDGSPQISASFVFSPYKDTTIDMNWNTNVISTNVSGTPSTFSEDLTAHGANSVTLAFATGDCGSETWGGVPGAALASANVSLLVQAGVSYVVSTGGAAGVFRCSNDAGFETFFNRWDSAYLIGFDFDIEAGQSESDIGDLVLRIQAAHVAHPSLRFSLTLATLANNDGATTAESLGTSGADSFNVYGDEAIAAVSSTLGFTGVATSWPSYVTINLMTMDYGSPSNGNCVVVSGACDMGQSAIQAAYNLHDKWGVPYENIELTPMIGGNDVAGEAFTLADVDAIANFVAVQHLTGVHYWSYDRDVDCAVGSASAVCNSMGDGYAGPYGYLQRFLAKGL